MNEPYSAEDALEVFEVSRDSARILTKETLEGGAEIWRLREVAAKVATYADEAIQIVRDEYQPTLDCKSGCWHCCCNPEILISIPELLTILAKIRETYDAEQFEAFRERLRQYMALVEGKSLAELAKQKPLPSALLVENSCSIYESRPLICRGWNSHDVTACIRDYEDGENKAGVPMFGLMKQAADGALVGTVHGLEAARGDVTLVDLSSALNVAMNYGEGFEEALLKGTPLLRRIDQRSVASRMERSIKEIARSERQSK